MLRRSFFKIGDFEKFFKDFDDAMYKTFGTSSSLSVYEKSEDGLSKIFISVPGFEKEELDLTIVNEREKLGFILKGKKKEKCLFVCDFEDFIPVKLNLVDIKSISSELKNGILTINLPYLTESNDKKLNKIKIT